MLTRFLNDNTVGMKLARTIFQGIIGVLIANADAIVGGFAIDPSFKPMVVAGVMAVLSPCMAMMKQTETFDLQESENDFGEYEEMDTVDND